MSRLLDAGRLALLIFSFTTSAQASPGISALRLANEGVEAAMRRNGVSTSAFRSSSSYYEVDPWSMTAVSQAEALGNLNRGLIPEWERREKLESAFQRIRDDRFIALGDETAELRGISWSYFYDGCFARAAGAAAYLEEVGHRRPAKLFIFGDLTFESASSEVVSWWFHVAPVVSVNGTPYVLDPAIEPDRPLEVREWVMRLAYDPDQVQVSVCNPFTYMPDDLCYLSGPEAENRAEDELRDFIRLQENQN